MTALCLLLLQTDPEYPRIELETAIACYSLTRDRGEWREESLEARLQFAPRTLLFSGVDDAERFGESDQQFRIGGYYPIDPWTFHAEYSTSPNHNVLPMHMGYAEAILSLDDGWGIGAGGRHVQYTHLWARVGSLLLEKYWYEFRVSYTLLVTDVENAGDGVSHRIDFAYYYRDRSFVKFAAAAGDEVENVGTPSILTSSIFYLVVSGRHDLSDRWALTYEVTMNRQGDTYLRFGFRVGIVVAF